MDIELSSPSRVRPLVAALLVALSAPAFGITTFNVNSPADQVDDDTTDGICHTAAGTCTLRAAIMQASHSSGIGVTVNVPAGHYTLLVPAAGGDPEQNGDLNFTGSVPISVIGAGKDQTIIDANQIDRLFSVAAGANATLQSMSLINGFAVNGGAVDVVGTLTLADVDISDSQATRGGGVDVELGGTLTMRGGSVSGCTASTGGGIYSSGGNLNLSNATISRNGAKNAGGIYTHLLSNAGNQLTGQTLITNSVVDSNSAIDQNVGYGGGIELVGNATIVNTTIASNVAQIGGAGVYVDYETPSGIGPIKLYNVTIVGNQGDGVYVNANSTTTFNIYNTLIASNFETDNPTPDDCFGTVVTYARNLFGNVSGCNLVPASGSFESLLNSTAYLGDLANNGGPTQTIALLPGSNAIDANSGYCVDQNGQPLLTDQRGYPRSTPCDVGAFEYSDVIFRNGFD
jgi:CSLREA domain-containing protein